jgi:hypothetical protein
MIDDILMKYYIYLIFMWVPVEQFSFVTFQIKWHTLSIS